MASKSFSPMEIDAIGEILNISLGASATAISTMLNTRVDITTPQVNVVTADEFCFSDLEPAIGVEINYVSGLDGNNIMLLKRSDIKMIVELLMGTEIPDDDFELDEMNLSAVCEVMNQMMGASSTALSEFLERPVNISTPKSFEIDSEETFKEKYFVPDVKMVVVKFLLNIDGRLKSEFVNVMPTILVKELLSVFFPEDAEDIEEEAGAAAGQLHTPPQPPAGGPAAASGQLHTPPQQSAGGQAAAPGQAPYATQPPADSQAAASGQFYTPQPPMPGQPYAPSQPAGMDYSAQQQLQQMMAYIQSLQNEIQALKKPENKAISGSPLHYSKLEGGGLAGEEQEENLELLMGVSLELSVEIGRARNQVKDILEFTKGTLVVLDKQAGDPVDLYVNGRCVAKGDVVVVDDSFGIRISEIVKQPL